MCNQCLYKIDNYDSTIFCKDLRWIVNFMSHFRHNSLGSGDVQFRIVLNELLHTVYSDDTVATFLRAFGLFWFSFYLSLKELYSNTHLFLKLITILWSFSYLLSAWMFVLVLAPMTLEKKKLRLRYYSLFNYSGPRK